MIEKPTTVKIEVRMDGKLDRRDALCDAMIFMRERFKVNVDEYTIVNYKIDINDQNAHVFTFLVGI